MLYVLLLNWILWCNDGCHKPTRIAGIPDLILSFVPKKIKWEFPKIARNKYNPLKKRNENSQKVREAHLQWELLKSARNKTSMRTDKKCAKQKLKENSDQKLWRYFNMAKNDGRLFHWNTRNNHTFCGALNQSPSSTTSVPPMHQTMKSHGSLSRNGM